MENSNILKEKFGTFDMSKAKRNPFVECKTKGKLNKVTLELDENIINHFRKASKNCGITFDNLINNYLARAL